MPALLIKVKVKFPFSVEASRLHFLFRSHHLDILGPIYSGINELRASSLPLSTDLYSLSMYRRHG